MTDSLDVSLLCYKIPDEVLTDLVCRFTSNIPHEERDRLVRVCFQIELAHWFFIDHYCQPGSNLHHLAHIPFNVFTVQVFDQTPYLKPHKGSVDEAIAEFRAYKCKVPTCGAILMTKDMNEVLLVQGFRNQWGFPKGKINKDEPMVECAIREVKEETSYDMSKLVNPNHFIESNANDRNATLYIVVGVDKDFPFRPQTAYEIKKISWFGIDELPENKNDLTVNCRSGYRTSNFFTVYSYVRRLKRWIQDKRDGTNRISNFRCFPIQGDGQKPEAARSGQQQQPLFSKSPGHGRARSDGDQHGQKQNMNPFMISVGGRPTVALPQQSTSTPQKPRNPKRRLNFDEPNNCLIGIDLHFSTSTPQTIVSPVRGDTISAAENSPFPFKKAEAVKPSIHFFSGLGASAWMNFKLDINEVLSSLN